MNLNEYQQLARSTAIYKQHTDTNAENLYYVTMGLCSEAGEIAGQVKKLLRGDPPDGGQLKLIEELGDVLWYVANIASELGVSLERVAKVNVNKLASRAKEGSLNDESKRKANPSEHEKDV